MCHDRGYLVTQHELDQSLEEFKEEFGDKPSMRKPGRQDLTILVAHNDDPTDQMFVFFPGIVFSRPDFLMWDNYLKNSSDGRVERASVLGAVYLGLIPSRAKPMTLKLVFTASLLGSWHSALKGQCGENVEKNKLYLLCRWERHLAGFHHVGVVNRWLAIPKRARIAH